LPNWFDYMDLCLHLLAQCTQIVGEVTRTGTDPAHPQEITLTPDQHATLAHLAAGTQSGAAAVQP